MEDVDDVPSVLLMKSGSKVHGDGTGVPARQGQQHGNAAQAVPAAGHPLTLVEPGDLIRDWGGQGADLILQQSPECLLADGDPLVAGSYAVNMVGEKGRGLFPRPCP